MKNDLHAVIGVYTRHTDAEDAIRTLRRGGFDIRRLSIIGKGYQSEAHAVGFYTTGDRMKTWGGIGAAWGGIGAAWGGLWGLLVGGAFFIVPGFGPVAVAGGLASLLVGALEGAVVGGGLSALGTGLMGLGLTREQAIKYEHELKADRYLLFVHGTEAEAGAARAMLKPVQAAA